MPNMPPEPIIALPRAAKVAPPLSKVFARASFFLLPSPLITPRCGRDVTNPRLESEFQVHQVITDDFLTYLMNEALELQVHLKEQDAGLIYLHVYRSGADDELVGIHL